MPETFDITEEDLGPLQDKPYEGDAGSTSTDGYFAEVDGQREPTPGTESVLTMTVDERREQMQDFAYTIVQALGEVLEVSDWDVTLTDPERRNLGEHWGNVLFHYWQIKTRKGLDVANATAYTSGLGVKKMKEIKDNNSQTTNENHNRRSEETSGNRGQG